MHTIQVRDVTLDTHAVLRRLAAGAGTSLQEYVRTRLEQEARTMMPAEVAEQVRRRHGRRRDALSTPPMTDGPHTYADSEGLRIYTDREEWEVCVEREVALEHFSASSYLGFVRFVPTGLEPDTTRIIWCAKWTPSIAGRVLLLGGHVAVRMLRSAMRQGLDDVEQRVIA